jgi:hypothetical protein
MVNDNLEMIRHLEQYRGQDITIKVRKDREEFFGNLDEGEHRKKTNESSTSIICNLDTIYLKTLQIINTIYANPIYIRGSLKGDDVVVPFNYVVEDYLHLRHYARNYRFTIDEIIVSGDSPITLKHFSAEVLHDGTKRVDPDDEKYSRQDADKMQNYPKLAWYGCRYDEDRFIITGNLEDLLRSHKPLW